ncbi:unnamed protein product [Bursaphelenchus xylophilus]|uniref:(pine wood nematode) hypothetical protein n=1 Tax=Bursaphelenchus xylophilus TaxID=6326 RepID=A0A1I7RUM6_BURXY|nr:unnamed protein product [Bursaphelenchus xylophilus]CAG9114230.1 unnamed protein product [Bursaphelenchus xylophilus]
MSFLEKGATCGQYDCSIEQRCVIKKDGEIIGCFKYIPEELTSADYFYYAFCIVYTMSMLLGMAIYQWKKFMARKKDTVHDPDIGTPPPVYRH